MVSQTDRWTYKQGRQINRKAERWIRRKTQGKTKKRWTERQADVQKDGLTDRQMDV
jgi:hypothetical protein